MPRQRRGSAGPSRSAPARPAAAPARPAPQQQQQRSSSTAAQPNQGQQQQGSQGSGLFGQMASTAAGVAVGSSIGHAVGGLFGGGSSSAPAETQQAPPPPAESMDNGFYQSGSTAGSYGETPGCENDVRAFRSCMDENSGNMSICGWYLDQLKACQAAAKPY